MSCRKANFRFDHFCFKATDSGEGTGFLKERIFLSCNSLLICYPCANTLYTNSTGFSPQLKLPLHCSTTTATTTCNHMWSRGSCLSLTTTTTTTTTTYYCNYYACYYLLLLLLPQPVLLLHAMYGSNRRTVSPLDGG